MRKHIGNVSVDSGQLLIIDPCYIETEWNLQCESKVIGIDFWGAGQDNVRDILQNKGFNPVKIAGKYRCHTEDNRMIFDIIEHIKKYLAENNPIVVYSPLRESSYDKVCDITMNEQQAGTLNDVMAVAFSSGFGDGVYEVYATYKTFEHNNMNDERIAKVEIILIED